MMILKPKRLHKGQTIGIVAPASPVERRDKMQRALMYLKNCGFKVKLGKHVKDVYGYLAGTDEARAQDINTMFEDPDVNAIFCLRGGYGSPRLLNLIDYETIARHPKIFAGYSDITALSCAIFAKTSLITFSSPMVVSDMVNPDPYSFNIFWGMLMGTRSITEIKNFTKHRRTALKKGSAQGRLIGGNLTLFTGLIGTGYMPSLNNALIFFEDVAEEPYRIDRMLSQCEHAGILNQLSGLVLGKFENCAPESKPSLSLHQVFKHYSEKLPQATPAVQGVSYGHTLNKHTLPFGAMARLIVSDTIKIELLEDVVV